MFKSGLLPILAWALVFGLIGALVGLSYFSVTRGLRGLRDFFHYFKWLLVAIVAIFVFGLFQGLGVGGAGFLGGGRGELTDKETVAQVAGRPVPLRDVVRQLDQYRAQYRAYGIGEEQAQQFAGTAIDGMISGEVEVLAARKAGLTVTDAELRDYITRRLMPRLKVKTGAEYAKRVPQLTPYGGPAELEAAMRDDLLREKFERLLADGRVVTDAEAKKTFLGEKETAGAEYMVFDAASLKAAAPAPAEAEVQAVYQRDLAKYQYGERRVVKIMTARAGDFQSGYEPTDSDLRGYLEKHKAELLERCASHLLVRVAPQAGADAEAAAKKAAEGYAARARGGEDFAKLADEHSEDPSGKGRGGDLGCFTADVGFVPEFKAAVFNAKSEGEIVGPVKTQFGWHVIKIRTIAKEPKPLADAGFKAQLAQKFKSDPSMMTTWRERAAKSGEWMGKLKTEAELEAAAKARGLRVQSTAERPIEKQGFIPGVGQDPGLMDRLFAAKPGEVLGDIDLGGGERAAAVVVSILPAGPKALRDVRPTIEDALKNEAARALARDRAAKLLAELKKGGALKDAAQRAGFIRPERKPDDKTPPPPEKPGSYFDARTLSVNAAMEKASEFPEEPGMTKTLLAAKAGDLVGPVETKQGVAVFHLTARTGPVEADYPKAKAEIVARLKRQKADAARSAAVDGLRKELEAAGEIIKNDALIKARFPQAGRRGGPGGFGGGFE